MFHHTLIPSYHSAMAHPPNQQSVTLPYHTLIPSHTIGYPLVIVHCLTHPTSKASPGAVNCEAIVIDASRGGGGPNCESNVWFSFRHVWKWKYLIIAREMVTYGTDPSMDFSHPSEQTIWQCIACYGDILQYCRVWPGWWVWIVWVSSSECSTCKPIPASIGALLVTCGEPCHALPFQPKSYCTKL